MKVLSSLIEYKVCKKCQVKITRSSSYCKGCQLKLDQAVRFFAYDQEPAPKPNKKKKVIQGIYIG
jgi:predicted amidophosphoribosyltransferase